jgi:hypothetical protein
MDPEVFVAGCVSSLISHMMMELKSPFVPDLRLILWSIRSTEELKIGLRGSFKGSLSKFFFGSCR